MDDILILSSNSKDLHKAMNFIKKKAKEMGLSIKPNWTIFKTKEDDKHPYGAFIDIMGFRIYRSHITIRRRIFKRIRSCYMKAHKCFHNLLVDLARKCLSYWGYLSSTDSTKFIHKYRTLRIKEKCIKVVSQYDKMSK